MKYFLWPVRLIYFLYACLIFLALMCCVLPVLAVAIALGTRRGGNLLNAACRYWSDIWLAMMGIWCPKTPNISGVPTKCIYVANHISYIDIPMIFKTVRRPLRILGKEEMKNVPVFGWIYRTAVVSVNRSSPAKRAASIRRLRAVLRTGISIFIFPEGTFNETGKPLKDFYDGAFRIAIEMQVPIQPVIFPDTLARMHYESLLSLCPGPCRILYLEPMLTEGLTLDDLPQLRQKVYDRMEAALIAAKQ